MADFDPVPKLSPIFRGLVFACGLMALGMACWGVLLVTGAAIRFFLALP
jgi:hypothetical protein